MTEPKLYRRRYIPDELTCLENDVILTHDRDVIVTSWKVLKPRRDFVRGLSCYFLGEGFKISMFINTNGECLYIYCDIIEVCHDEDDNSYIFNDLLADIIIYNDGFVKVTDLAEISDALDENLITLEQAKYSLRILDKLLGIIYSGRLEEYMLILRQWTV